MKKKSIFILLLIMTLTASVSMASCSKIGGKGKSSSGNKAPATLEEYAVSNPDVQKSIDEATSDSDVEVDIKGNDVIYSYELSKMEGYTEDVATDPDVIENLQKALDNAGPTFGGIAKTLEKATGISGIRVIVRYTFDGEELATQTFDASDAAAEDSSGDKSDGSDSDSDSESDSGSETEEGDGEAEEAAEDSAE